MFRPGVWLLPLALSACTVGMVPTDFEVARHPQGVSVAIATGGGGGQFVGELLEVTEVGLLVRGRPSENARRELDRARFDRGARDMRLRRFPVPSIDRIWVHQRSDLNFADLRRESRRAELRPLARFPQGVSEEILRSLLEIHGQDEVEYVTTGGPPDR